MTEATQDLNEHKADFTSAYNEKTPHTYFATMQALEYQIPENAKPKINLLIEKIKERRLGTVSILDLGCSYGVISALIQFGLPLPILYRRYQASASVRSTRQSETNWYASFTKRSDVEFYGIDTSENAIEFATSVGLLKEGVAVNLEDQHSSPALLARLPKHVDLIISTGCVGYITEVTFNKVLLHLTDGSHPVIASFVLRAFDYSVIAEMLSNRGYKTFKLPEKTFIQRRFKDDKEQAHILSLLKRDAVSHCGTKPPETDGYYHAELFVSVHESSDLAIGEGLERSGKET